MRHRLWVPGAALIIAAAVVFAPGWQGEGRIQPPSPGSDLAGRILAPTVDNAVVREAVTDKDQSHLRQVKRRPMAAPLPSAGPGPMGIALLLFWFLLSSIRSIPRLYWLRPRRGRAPPRLQPA